MYISYKRGKGYGIKCAAIVNIFGEQIGNLMEPHANVHWQEWPLNPSMMI
jgi:hypothetical protein